MNSQSEITEAPNEQRFSIFPSIQQLGSRLATASAKLEAELIEQGALVPEAQDLFAAIVHARVSKAFVSQVQSILEHATRTQPIQDEKFDMDAERVRADAAFDSIYSGLVDLGPEAPAATSWSVREAFIQGALHTRRMDEMEPTVHDYDNLIRELCCSLSVGGWNSDGLMPIETARKKIFDGIKMLTEPLEDRISDLRETIEGLHLSRQN